MNPIDYKAVPTPAYVVDERLLSQNLTLMKRIMEETNAKILLAQKGFSMYYFYPLIREYLAGTTASSYHEARLGAEEMGGEVHIFNPAYTEEEFPKIIKLCDHIVFNTPAQLRKFKPLVDQHNQAVDRKVSIGLRINPEYSEIEHEIYNPCASGSRLGTALCNITNADFDLVDGLHFHTMCEQNSDTLERTLAVIEDKFGTYLHQMKWLNFGGGHHITRNDYDVDKLIACIRRMKDKYNLQVYLEPGEAVALNTGFLVAKVLDFSGMSNECAILDTSAACHMPDVLEMPYRPEIIGSGKPKEKQFTYRLGGPTCLAGDIIGDYSFDQGLKIGQKLIFCDMAHYSMVKNNTFNGINLPSIYAYTKDEKLVLVKEFGYEDFKRRL
jgi:carboxynorspermidine decarboxylase